MLKNKYSWTEDRIQQHYKEGRGQGRGKAYKPWLDIDDVSLGSRSNRPPSIKTGRIHQFLSDTERDFFYLLEWSPTVVDIRERFPLDRNETLIIAEEAGIKHPAEVRTNTPLVVYSDYVITIRENNREYEVVRSILHSSKLANPRVVEKHEIERRYWASRNVDWDMVTEQSFPKTMASNIDWLIDAYDLEHVSGVSGLDLDVLKKAVLSSLLSGSGSIGELTDQLDRKYQLTPGDSFLVLKHLLARKVLLVDITQPLGLSQSVATLTVPETAYRGEIAL